MPRRPRLDLPEHPQHIIQRGNDRQACFYHADDRQAYLQLLREYALSAGVDIHAYVLMTNHVHLLVTGRRFGAVSTLMQDLGRRYVRYVNGHYRRTGTLWEGRFRSCLVADAHYLLTCQRYIELNPVRAGMVARPEDYAWSSYSHHAGLGEQPWLTPHADYLALAAERESRFACYRELVASGIDDVDVAALRRHTQQGAPWGSTRFAEEITAMLGRRAAWQSQGRPRKTASGKGI